MGKHSRCYQEIKNTETTPDIVTVCETEITDNVQYNPTIVSYILDRNLQINQALVENPGFISYLRKRTYDLTSNLH